MGHVRFEAMNHVEYLINCLNYSVQSTSEVGCFPSVYLLHYAGKSINVLLPWNLPHNYSLPPSVFLPQSRMGFIYSFNTVETFDHYLISWTKYSRTSPHHSRLLLPGFLFYAHFIIISICKGPSLTHNQNKDGWWIFWWVFLYKVTKEKSYIRKVILAEA